VEDVSPAKRFTKILAGGFGEFGIGVAAVW
jgi:hypothetical protein